MGRLAALLLALVLMLWAAPVSAQGAIGDHELFYTCLN